MQIIRQGNNSQIHFSEHVFRASGIKRKTLSLCELAHTFFVDIHNKHWLNFGDTANRPQMITLDDGPHADQSQAKSIGHGAPYQFRNAFPSRFRGFAFESQKTINPTIREKLRRTVETAVSKLQENCAMTGAIKRKGATLNVCRQLNFRESATKVFGYLLQMWHLFRRNHHESAGRDVGR